MTVHMGRQSYLKMFLTELKYIKTRIKPPKGWIRTYKEALGMPGHFLAKKLHMTPGAVNHAIKRELEETITVKGLRKFAEAMDCSLYYAFIPNNDWPDEVLWQKAKAIVKRELPRKGLSQEEYEEALHHEISKYVTKKISEIWKEEEQKLFGKKS